MTKPKRKPVRKTHCPVCCHGSFRVTTVHPAVYRCDYLDNGDTVIRLDERPAPDDADRVECLNCGWVGGWAGADSWRRSGVSS